MRWFFPFFLFYAIDSFAQSDIIDQYEAEYKDCTALKEDSIVCYRVYYYRMDSMMNVIFTQVKNLVPAGEKGELLKDQLSWNSKRETFFKKQDANFVFNLNEGIWKKDMIRYVYKDKGDYLLKRMRALLKRATP
jgi:hypothetical protein